MSRRAITDEQRIDAYISTAPRDALVRLQSEVSAALKYRDFALQGVAVDIVKHRKPKSKDDTHTPLGSIARLEPKDAAQMPLAKEVCRALRIPVLEVPGYEADDLIATCTRAAGRAGSGRRGDGGPAADRGGHRDDRPGELRAKRRLCHFPHRQRDKLTGLITGLDLQPRRQIGHKSPRFSRPVLRRCRPASSRNINAVSTRLRSCAADSSTARSMPSAFALAAIPSSLQNHAAAAGLASLPLLTTRLSITR